MSLDVVKPFPARQLERLHGGFGVMADDAMAAIYANLLLRGAYYLAPGWLVVRAEVIAVGSEMLTPTHVDTNSLFITERLNEIGIDLQGKAIAGDDRGVLKAIVADALARSDLLILTGGLGPTDDDLTRDVVADLIGRPLEYHAHIFEAIQQRFAARGLRTPDINRRQAMVPQGAAVLPNKNGTAPGLWIEHERKLIVLLPGPPRELKPMFEAVIQERLLGHVGASRLFRRLSAHHRPERIVRRREDAAALREVACRADDDHHDDSRVARSDRAAPDGDRVERR